MSEIIIPIIAFIAGWFCGEWEKDSKNINKQ